MTKAVCIIQARCGSTRLPDKILLPLGSMRVLEHVIERALAIKSIDEVILATTTSPSDDVVEKIASDMGASVYRGSEYDVLDRYYQAAMKAKATHVMRITADCPLLDPEVCEALVNEIYSTKADYGGIIGFPHGLDCEFFTVALLQEAHKEATSKEDREHVTLWMKRHEAIKKSYLRLEDSLDYKSHRWTIDYPEDYEFLQALFDLNGGAEKLYAFKDIIEILAGNSHLDNINTARAKDWAEQTRNIYKRAEKLL